MFWPIMKMSVQAQENFGWGKVAKYMHPWRLLECVQRVAQSFMYWSMETWKSFENTTKVQPGNC